MPDVTEEDRIRALGRPAPVEAPAQGRPTSRWRLLWVWLLLGTQSFGGGTATLFMIRRAVVDQQRWLTDEEFTRDWSLCFMAPGINLLAMTVLVGRRVGGVAGSLIALAGLLLPSVTITIVMAALYSQLQRFGAVQAALEGIVPATVGLGLMLAVGMVRPLLATSRAEGAASLGVSVALLVGSMGAAVLWSAPLPLVLCGAGALGAAAAWLRAARGTGQP